MAFAARVALLCVLAAATIGAAPPSLLAVLSHMRAIDGGLYEAHVASTVPHLVDGRQMTLQADVQGLRYTLHECNGAICAGTYFDGERLFSVNFNGTALPRSSQPEMYLRALRSVSTLEFLDPAFGAMGGKVVDGGDAPFEGRRCRRIFVTADGAIAMAVYVDERTWLVAGARDVDGNAVYAMRDYRRVGRFQLPFEVDRNGIPLERYTARRIADAPLETPNGLQPQLGTPPAGMSLDPLSPMPVGSCTIGGRSERCLIDTGNSGLAMSLELSEQLGLEPVGMTSVAGLGEYATEVVRAGPLDLGNVRFPQAYYVVLADIHRYGYDLVLGADVLANTPVTIDYARHALYFGSNAVEARGGTAVPLAFQNFVPVVNVTLSGLPATLAVDTGDQSNINLAYDYYTQHASLFKTTHVENVSGVGGTSVEMIGDIANVRIGDYAAGRQQIGTTRTLRGTADGHLGTGFLSKFSVVLDYAHERLKLVPHT